MHGMRERQRRMDQLIGELVAMRLRVDEMSAARDRVRSMENKPTIGRIVHFLHSDGGKRAAIITAVHNDECVNLAVFPPSGPSYSETSVLMGADAGRWCWPTRI
jgi:hypothetical protein